MKSGGGLIRLLEGAARRATQCVRSLLPWCPARFAPSVSTTCCCWATSARSSRTWRSRSLILLSAGFRSMLSRLASPYSSFTGSSRADPSRSLEYRRGISAQKAAFALRQSPISSSNSAVSARWSQCIGDLFRSPRVPWRATSHRLRQAYAHPDPKTCWARRESRGAKPGQLA